MRRVSLTLCFLLATGVCLAGEALTWDTCVAEATKNNLDLKVAQESARSARFDKLGSVSGFLPQVSAGAQSSRSGSDSSIPSILDHSSDNPSNSLSLSVKQNLFSGFKDLSTLNSAKAREDMAQAGLQDAKARLSRDLKKAFYQMLYTQEQVTLLESIADSQKENVRLVELGYESGRENKGSLLQSQASSAQAVYEVSQSRRNLRVAQRRLARLLGRDEWEAFSVTGTLQNPPTPSEPPDFRKLVPFTPAHLQAQAQLDQADAGVSSARGAFLPSLDATGSMSRRGEEWPPKETGWSAGLSLSIPLFSGGQNYFSLKSAKSGQDQARDNLKSSDSQIALDLEDAFSNFQDSHEQTKVRKINLQAAQTREEIARAQYANGLLSFQDWDLIENALINSQKNDLSGLFNVFSSQADWEYTQGKGVIP